MNPFLFALVLFSANTVYAFEPAEFKPNAVDETNLLTPEQVGEINQQIEVVKEKAAIWSAVYLVQNLDGTTIEDAAIATFKKWKLGEQGKDNGLLFIFSISERRARIEVGYGLEGDITDAHSKRVLDDVILPYFKNAQYSEGIIAGLRAVGHIKTNDPAFLDERLEKIFGQVEEPATEVDWDTGFKYWGIWCALVFGYGFSRRLLMALTNSKKLPSLKALIVGETLFLTIFLSVNPGVFIAILGPMYGKFALDAFVTELQGEWNMRIQIAFAIVGIIFLFSPFVRMIGYAIGKYRNNINPVFKYSFGRLFLFVSGLKLIEVKIAFALVAVLATMFIPYETLPLEVFYTLCTLVVLFFVSFLCYNWFLVLRPLLSTERYRRQEARQRLVRIKNRTIGTRTIFGKSHTYNPSRSSSGSSSSSSRSSSGGGRSGGGGASSSW